VRTCVREIHRDPANFPDPERFDPDRFLERVGRERYSPFGIDQRSCLGEQLTRTAARVFALEVARGLDLTTRRDGPIEMSLERHWSPSSRWRLELRRRTPPGVDT
jgi:cytochrome P450